MIHKLAADQVSPARNPTTRYAEFHHLPIMPDAKINLLMEAIRSAVEPLIADK